ncbi:MAG: DUF1691 domain-containing protein [bacterium]|nr:DUF1691 domain-containing protein [bacterium]
MTDRKLARYQAISGLALGTFLILHLANTVVATAGPEAYEGFKRAARGYYRIAAAEIALVVGSALVHMACGIARLVVRRRAARERRVSARVGAGTAVAQAASLQRLLPVARVQPLHVAVDVLSVLRDPLRRRPVPRRAGGVRCAR